MKKQLLTFPDYYADEHGDIYNKQGHKMSPFVDTTGYWQLKLRKNKTIHHVRAHRLVYEAFYGKIPDGMQINHIDGNKLNNSINNLETVTNQENTQHAYDNGLYHSIKPIEVQVFNKDMEYLFTCPSIRSAAKRLSINRKLLSAIIFNGKNNNTDYIFKVDESLIDEGQTTIESVAA